MSFKYAFWLNPKSANWMPVSVAEYSVFVLVSLVVSLDEYRSLKTCDRTKRAAFLFNSSIELTYPSHSDKN